MNQADVLPLGLHWNRTGTVRQNASMQWVGQLATPWSPVAATYADANGDGIVNQGDVLPIGFNWGRNHTTSLTLEPPTNELNSLPGSMLQPEVNGAPAPGQEFLLRIKTSGVTDLFGLAFELNSDRPELVKIQTVEPDTFLGEGAIFYANVDSAMGKVAAGISRKLGQSGVSGTGSVIRIKAVVSSKAQNGETVTFSLRDVSAIDSGGLAQEMSLQSLQIVIVTTSVESRNGTRLVTDYRLHQNYPNPFNPGTMIQYDLPKAGQVRLVVYNALGQEVRTLVNEPQPAGQNQAAWDGREEQGLAVPSGLYIYRLEAGTFVQCRKMQLLR